MVGSACAEPPTPAPVLPPQAPPTPPAPLSAPDFSPTPAVIVSPSALPTATPAHTSTPAAPPSPTPSPTPTPAVLIGAGDIAVCGVDKDEKTADVIERQLILYPQAVVMAIGDTVNESGRMVEYRSCFTPSWGRFLNRIRPVPGNHDLMTEQGAPYYAYFGAAAGAPGLGYYSFNLGDWHIVALNSNCDQIACGSASYQARWLREDLQKNRQRCTLLYWHHPRFASGIQGSVGTVYHFWRIAYEYGAEVVVSGNDHHYERFAPQDPDGRLDLQRGIRQFVVGTGGAELRGWGTIKPNSEVRHNHTHGVIQFKLYPDRYEWEFLPIGGAFRDSGAGECH